MSDIKRIGLRGRRRGIASVIAMLFMVLFVTLSLGFYAATTTSVQIASNARYQNDAMYAAESGLQFISYHLRSMPGTPSTDPATIYAWVTAQLDARLAGYENMRDATDNTKYDPNAFITGTTNTYYAPGFSLVNNKPRPHWMRLGTNAGTTFVMVQLDTHYSPAKLFITSVGKSAGNNPSYRALQYELKSLDNPTVTTTTTTSTQTVQTPWAAPNGTIVTYSAISAHDGSNITSNVMALPSTSQVPANIVGNSHITGTFTYPKNYPAPTIDSSSSTGATSQVATVPPVPTVDTSTFATLVPPTTQAALGSTWTNAKTYAGVVLDKNSIVGTNNTFNNIRIKANSDLTINANNSVFNGVIYIESPNKINFAGAVINGVIVSDNNPSVPYDPYVPGPKNTVAPNNTVTFSSGTKLNGTASITGVPSAEAAHMAALKAMFVDASGNQVNASSVLTPNFGLNFLGGTVVTGGAAIVGSQFTVANGSSVSLSGVMLSTGKLKFDVGGGMSISNGGLPSSWPGMTTTTQQTVTNSVNTTVSSVTVAVNRSTYTEIDPWQFVK